MFARVIGPLAASLLGSAALAGELPSQETAAPANEGPEERYQQVSIPLDAPPEAALAVPSFDAMLRQFGVFERAQPGESVELMALRLGRDPKTLRLTSRFEEGHQFDTEELVCVERHHLLFPDESLEFVAELHQTDVTTLRALNDLTEGAAPQPWTDLRVPVQYDAAVHEQQEYRTVRVYFGDISGLVEGRGPLEITDFRTLWHEVKEGDTWASIAEARRVTVEDLQFGRTFQKEHRRWRALLKAEREGDPKPELRDETNQPPPLVVGEWIPGATSVRLKPGRPLFELVLTFEYLCGDLRKLLELNGLDTPEELTGLKKVKIPLAFPSLQFALNFDDEIPRLAPPKRHEDAWRDGGQSAGD